MNYKKELQEIIYFNYSDEAIQQLDLAMKAKDNNKIRIILEDQLDDKILFYKGKIRDAYKSTYNERKKAYSLFMTDYIKELDYGSNNRR